MLISNDCIRFADIKNHFFFHIILLQKHFDKMTMSRSSICNFFFRRNPPDLWGIKKNMNVQNKKKTREEKNILCNFRNSFLFWTNKKKVSSYERNFLLFLPIKCWSNIFWLLWGFIRWCENVFFCLFKTRKNYECCMKVFFLH